MRHVKIIMMGCGRKESGSTTHTGRNEYYTIFLLWYSTDRWNHWDSSSMWIWYSKTVSKIKQQYDSYKTASTNCGFLVVTGTCRVSAVNHDRALQLCYINYQFKDGRPTANTVKCQTKQCDSVIAHEGCCTSENSMPVSGDVSTTRKFCNGCGYGVMLLIMAVQMMAQMHKHIHYKWLSWRCPYQIEKVYKLNETSQELDTSLDSVHSISHDQLDYRKLCACWVPKNVTDKQKSQHKNSSGICKVLIMFIWFQWPRGRN